MAKADLHIHTTASDGKMSPGEVVREAARLKLSAIAITDHDTTEGVAEARQEALDCGLTVLSGSEITTDFNGRECHMLAYDFDMEDEGLNDLLYAHQQARIDRAKWIIGRLRSQGLELDIDEVRAEAGGRNVGRPHIAEVLRKKGYIGTIKTAFIRYLSDEALGPIKSNYRSHTEVIRVVKAAGGVIVLAHPGRLYDEDECQVFAESGIDGFEALHPSHNYEIQKQMEEFAKQHNLLITGGSDFHGSKKSYYRYFGTLTISQTWVNKIRTLGKRRKKVSAE